MIRVANLVSVSMLKPHPKNSEYFSAPSPEEREKIKKSIEANGIRDPLKVLPDYTVIAGHVRLEIAKELGVEKVPVEVWDVSPEEAEYLLVADNEERRICQDPIKKAKRAEFLKRYWGIQRGRPEKMDQIDPFFKSMDDIAKAIGESRGNLKRLLKLNDLIPEFQALVSQDKLSQIAAYSLAFLSPEEQKRLLDILGESGICGLSVKEAQVLRREIEAEHKRAEELAKRLAETEKALSVAKEGSAEAEKLKAEIEVLRKENAELRARQPEVVERVVEKVVYKPDPALEAELDAARAEAAKLLKEREWFEKRLHDTVQDKERKEAKLRNLEEEVAKLQRRLDHAWSELKKEKEKPRPHFDVRKEEFRALAQKAQSVAFELSDVLKKLEEQYSGELLAASRVRGGPEFEDIGSAVVDATVFGVLKTALEMASERIIKVFELLEGGKPRLHLVKIKEREGC
ncbi:MAG: ParB N-terminal domain-containing protein [Moorellaceae bacterium]